MNVDSPFYVTEAHTLAIVNQDEVFQDATLFSEPGEWIKVKGNTVVINSSMDDGYETWGTNDIAVYMYRPASSTTWLGLATIATPERMMVYERHILIGTLLRQHPHYGIIRGGSYEEYRDLIEGTVCTCRHCRFSKKPAVNPGV
jgi:hypothetical protein